MKGFAVGTPLPAGPVFRLNSMRGFSDTRSVTALENGTFVFVWLEGRTVKQEDGQLVDQSVVCAQIYYADGTKLGSETIVSISNTDLYSGYSKPTVAALKDGGFVVSYAHQYMQPETELHEYDIYSRIYEADGSAGAEFLATASAIDQQMDPVVVPLKDGGYVMTYASWEASEPLRIQKYGPDGSRAGDEISLPGGEYGMATLGDGFVVVYEGWDPVELKGSPEGYIFKADGTQIKFHFGAPAAQSLKQFQTSVTALADGRFVAVWSHWDQTNQTGDGSLSSIRAQIFNADGTLAGSDFQVNVKTDGSQRLAKVAALPNGGFAVAYEDVTLDLPWENQTRSVRVVTFDRHGHQDGDEVALSTGGFTYGPESVGITALDDGRLVVTWTETRRGSEGGSYSAAQVLDPRVESLNWSGSDDEDNYVGTVFDDTLKGMAGKDRLYGNNGSDTLDGGTGADSLDGGTGFDLVSYAVATSRVDVDLVKKVGSAGEATGDVLTAVEGIVGSAFNDKLVGDDFANLLKGGTGKDDLQAGSDHDKIWGGAGNDSLKGGAGLDIFVFDTKANTRTNKDKIADFKTKDDTIWLDNKVFMKLGRKGTEDKPAQLNKSFFTVGSKAKDKNDYLVYDKAKGVLSYDADGSGKGKAVEIAQLSKKLAMTYKDFFVI
jgi:Ca2+-binding RTX toxin-like protein